MMKYIQVPDHNDSYTRIVLDRKEYLLRFLYNGFGNYWTFGIYDTNKVTILQQRKIVPLSPLTHFDKSASLPAGIFGCFTKKNRIGRKDFVNRNAEFAFIPESDVLEWREENGIF